MAKSIYKVFMGRKLDAWYRLSPKEQQSIESRLVEALKKVGAKRLVVCDSTWSSDQWQFAGVEEFPNIEAVQEYMAAVNELGVFRYVESTSVLGTRLELG
jgi:hypothetical protein